MPIKSRTALYDLARVLVLGATPAEAAAKTEYALAWSVRALMKTPKLQRLMREAEQDLARELRGRLLEDALEARKRLREMIDGKVEATAPAVSACRTALDLYSKVGAAGRVARIETQVEDMKKAKGVQASVRGS